MLLFIVSSPSSYPVDPKADAALETDYTVDDPSFVAELPGKQPPLTHAYITYSFSLLLALELLLLLIYPILMHSLFLVTVFETYLLTKLLRIGWMVNHLWPLFLAVVAPL